jgi:hypothetical protein
MVRLLPGAPSAVAAIILVVYHLILLVQRLADLSLLQPAVALRWLITVALLMGLRRMHAAGVPMIWGRRALAFWLLVLLMHVSFLGPLSDDTGTTKDQRSEVSLALILPATVPVALLLTLVVIRWLAVRGGSTNPAALRPLELLNVELEHPSRGGWLPSLASRPPPALS